MSNIHAIILVTIDNLVTNFVCYDRKEDKNLPLGAIETAIKNKDITIDEMVKEFEKHLKISLHPMPTK